MSNVLESDTLINSLGGRIIFLVGMMGSGKSKTGPTLAKALNYSFVDQDDLIERVAKMSIAEIFAKEGETNFRDLETQVLKEIGKRHSLVVATGGGIVLKPENWGVLHQGIVVWIHPSRQQLLTRLELDQTVRPLIKKSNLLSSIDQLIKDRKEYYEQSDLHIKVENETPLEVALEIIQQLPNIINNPQVPNE